MGEDSAEVKELLVVLTLKIRQCHMDMDAQAILNCLTGIQSMSDSKEVLGLLAALTPQINGCADIFKQREGRVALRILECLGDAKEVKKATEALLAKFT